MLLSNIDLSKSAGINADYYRSQYRYCSAFAHSAPFSISQMDSFRYGTLEAEGLFRMLTSVATGYSAFAVRDFARLFPDQEADLSPEVRKCILEWEDIFKWEMHRGLYKPSA